jgi:hypothetical protein
MTTPMHPRQQLAAQHGLTTAQLLPPADTLQVALSMLAALAHMTLPEGSPLGEIQQRAAAGVKAIQGDVSRVVLAGPGALAKVNGRH